MNRSFAALLALVILAAASPAAAHRLWLNTGQPQPVIGEEVAVEIGWGHKFPQDEVIKEGFLRELYALAPDGQKVEVREISRTRFAFTPEIPGTYTLRANVHPGFLSKTPQGYKLQSKRDLEEVVRCFRYDIRTKALICTDPQAAGSGRGGPDPLEIDALTAPARLAVGGSLELRVLFKGRPLAEAEVHATYAGFSDQPSTYAVNTQTDQDGLARIEILAPGPWMVHVTYEIPYPDPQECDTLRYNTTLTFQVP